MATTDTTTKAVVLLLSMDSETFQLYGQLCALLGFRVHSVHVLSDTVGGGEGLDTLVQE